MCSQTILREAVLVSDSQTLLTTNTGLSLMPVNRAPRKIIRSLMTAQARVPAIRALARKGNKTLNFIGPSLQSLVFTCSASATVGQRSAAPQVSQLRNGFQNT